MEKQWQWDENKRREASLIFLGNAERCDDGWDKYLDTKNTCCWLWNGNEVTDRIKHDSITQGKSGEEQEKRLGKRITVQSKSLKCF